MRCEKDFDATFDRLEDAAKNECAVTRSDVSSSSYVRISRVTPVTGKGPTSKTHVGTFLAIQTERKFATEHAGTRVDLNDKLDRDAGTVRNRKLPRRCSVRSVEQREMVNVL